MMTDSSTGRMTDILEAEAGVEAVVTPSGTACSVGGGAHTVARRAVPGAAAEVLAAVVHIMDQGTMAEPAGVGHGAAL